jgi:hypothetical protein
LPGSFWLLNREGTDVEVLEVQEVLNVLQLLDLVSGERKHTKPPIVPEALYLLNLVGIYLKGQLQR